MTKVEALKNLQQIPAVGKSISQDLYDLGIRKVADLKSKHPEKMYYDLCRKRGQHIDRCMLYVFRCAMYYAFTKKPKPNKLLWWNWKD
ncbi:MAG TPA: helix-hairpin-helix domain-containing protein [candidate division Zixibacteria bacterium]|nr:helix-hairpin-helix domain-containing protein [candidate division Zixibacteria bacterium]